jgi:hypothetical protein
VLEIICTNELFYGYDKCHPIMGILALLFMILIVYNPNIESIVSLNVLPLKKAQGHTLGCLVINPPVLTFQPVNL